VDGSQSGLWARLASNPQEFQDRASVYADLQVEHVDDSGHNIHHDQPERLAAVIEAFMRGR
jgi:pimeloyl-ACP methyl ester carboxylesterase